MIVRIVIDDTPTSWTPPRVMRRGFSYNPKSKQKAAARAQVLHQYRSDPLKGPISVVILFHMPIPSSASKRIRKAMLDGEIKHTKKLDLDNMAKFLLDCIKGIVIEDDNQVFTLYAKKIYSDTPKTIAEIEEH